MSVNSVTFKIPESLNASSPPERRGTRRDHVRLMVLNKENGEVSHDRFNQLSNYIDEGDLLVLNNSRTIPAVLFAMDQYPLLIL